jgi:hypothetical protein
MKTLSFDFYMLDNHLEMSGKEISSTIESEKTASNTASNYLTGVDLDEDDKIAKRHADHLKSKVI